MKFSNEESQHDEAFEINVIPLIDVLLVLLIFFMASASFVSSGGFDVSLPQAQAKLAGAKESSLTVTVTATGQIAIGAKIVSVTELRELFDSEAAKASKPSLVVRADERVEHGAVIRVLDEAKAAGLEEIAISAIPKQ